MSIRSMSELAVERDLRRPRKPGPRRAGAGGEDDRDVEAQSRSDILISAIPTEVLAPYTFLIGVIVSTIDPNEDERLGLRWTVYGVAFAFIVIALFGNYVRLRKPDKRRKFPLPEMLSAIVAFGAWGLIMPGTPLAAEISEDDFTIWSAIITVVAIFVISVVLGTPLKEETKKAK